MIPVDILLPLILSGLPVVLFGYYLLYHCLNDCNSYLQLVPYPKVGIIRLKNEPSNMYIQYCLLHITAPFSNYLLIDTRHLTHSQIYSRLHTAFNNHHSQIILLGTFAMINDYEIWKQYSLQNNYSYYVRMIDGNKGR